MTSIQRPALRFLHIAPFTVLFASLLPLTAQAALQDCAVGGKSVSPDNGNTTAGLTGIMRCVDRETRLPTRERELQNGRFQGVERSFEQGKLVREQVVNERGNKEGLAKTYAPSGKLIAEEVFKSGAHLGLQKYFFESGPLKRLNFFELRKDSPAGLPFIHTENIASIEFNENGKLKALHCGERPVLKFEAFDDRILCGFAGDSQQALFDAETRTAQIVLRQGLIISKTSYWPNGRPSFELSHADSGSTETRYNQAGQKLSETTYVQNGKARSRSLERVFHESGQIISEKRWVAGALSREAAWYLNGQAKSVVEYLDASITQREFHDNGQRKFEGQFVRERNSTRRTGDHLHFDDKGQLRIRHTYDERGRIAREREYDPSGTLLRDDTVFEDGSRKAFAR